MPVYSPQEQMIMDLRKEGYDCHQIASKLEITVTEVEDVVFGFKDEDIDILLMWTGAHH